MLVNRSTGYYFLTMTRPDLCLDFANTRYWRGQAAPTETLNAPGRPRRPGRRRPRPPRPGIRPGARACARRSTGCSTPRRRARRRRRATSRRSTRRSRRRRAARTLKRGRDGYDWEVDARSARRSPCWRRCCGRPATCWPGRGSTGCGAAPIPNAAGCSSTTAARASAAGARCRPAATAPRPGGIITRARKKTPDPVRP